MKLGHGVLALGIIGLLAGCNTLTTPPAIMDATITPAQLGPGDTAVIAVKVNDKHDLIGSIDGVIREYPGDLFRLHDDGTDPDETANDGIWSMRVDVPFQAPPGEFTLDFTAYRADGRPLEVAESPGDAVPLQATVKYSIQYDKQ